jgi:large subunit ribosomal protein L6
MSRIGKKPVGVPAGVEVRLQGGSVAVKGPKGELDLRLRSEVAVEQSEDGKQLLVTRTVNSRSARAYHGLTRALVNNMVVGVSEGFTKKLEIHGVGYNARVQGKALRLQIGFCHPVDFDIPAGLTVECPTNVKITITGCDKQAVGQFAAKVRAIRPPEPYNAKGIRYEGEYIQRKAGKSFVSSD